MPTSSQVRARNAASSGCTNGPTFANATPNFMGGNLRTEQDTRNPIREDPNQGKPRRGGLALYREIKRSRPRRGHAQETGAHVAGEPFAAESQPPRRAPISGTERSEIRIEEQLVRVVAIA